jgi:LysR family transcriptional regulator, regulator for bpeEF and oprC
MSVSPADLFAGIMPFVATVEGRSLTRAARLLGVTPSAVSRAITKLESDLGVRLLNRTPRTVTLTPEGTIFYRECQSAVGGVRHAHEAVSQALQSPRGVLRVSLPLALGELIVMPALPRLLARHAGLSVEATLTDRYVDLVAENFDAVVRIGEPRSSGLKRHRLPPVRWSTVASPAYLTARGTPRRPQDLTRHNCLHFALPNGTTQPWRFNARRAAVQRIATQGNLASDHPGGLLQATLAGLGLLQAHSYIVSKAVAEGRLVEVLEEFVPPPLPAAVLFPAGRERSPSIRAFVGAMAELLSVPR